MSNLQAFSFAVYGIDDLVDRFFIEIFRGGRRIAPEKEAFVHFLGFVSLMAVVIFITFFDIRHLVS